VLSEPWLIPWLTFPAAATPPMLVVLTFTLGWLVVVSYSITASPIPLRLNSDLIGLVLSINSEKSNELVLGVPE
jgi:hypothetical protein